MLRVACPGWTPRSGRCLVCHASTEGRLVSTLGMLPAVVCANGRCIKDLQRAEEARPSRLRRSRSMARYFAAVSGVTCPECAGVLGIRTEVAS